jgi:hypothetical protein
MAGIAHGMKPRSGASPSPEVAREMVEATPAAKRKAFSKAIKKRSGKGSMSKSGKC